MLLMFQLIVSGGGLTLSGCQVPTKATLSLPSLAGKGRDNITTGLWVEIRTGRDQSPITSMGKIDSTWGKIIQVIINQIRIG